MNSRHVAQEATTCCVQGAGCVERTVAVCRAVRLLSGTWPCVKCEEGRAGLQARACVTGV